MHLFCQKLVNLQNKKDSPQIDKEVGYHWIALSCQTWFLSHGAMQFGLRELLLLNSFLFNFTCCGALPMKVAGFSSPESWLWIGEK